MDDMISRQAALDALEGIDCSDGVGISTLKCDTVNDAITVIKALPTVDAVPVVRCWDCRFWSKYPGSSAAPQYHECMARMTHIGNLYTTAGEYCSRGERKDGDNEQDKKS